VHIKNGKIAIKNRCFFMSAEPYYYLNILVTNSLSG